MGLKLEQFFVVKWPVRRPSTRKAAKSSGTGGARSSHSNSLIVAHNATNTCLAWSMAPQLLPVQQAQHVQCAHASAMQHHVVARNMRSVKQTKCFARSARAIHTLFSRCSSSRLPSQTATPATHAHTKRTPRLPLSYHMLDGNGSRKSSTSSNVHFAENIRGRTRRSHLSYKQDPRRTVDETGKLSARVSPACS